MVADIHGNDVALRAVWKDAVPEEVDQWWALGGLVLFGPQPAPHATAADAVGSLDLVERYGAMAAGIGWTRGVLDQAGLLDSLTALPMHLRLKSASGASVLGVHASPRADDGAGIEPGMSDEQLRLLLAGCDADVVAGGHTHVATDRLV